MVYINVFLVTAIVPILSSVPQPSVDIILSHTAPLYAGTGLTLTCKVTLDTNVDNGERILTEWSGIQDIPKKRYSFTACGSSSTYTDSLTISPLADQDDGTYTCTVTVTGEVNVKQATASDDVNITVMGEYMNVQAYLQIMNIIITYIFSALPKPKVMISPENSRVIAGGTHTVQCIMTGIPYLAVPPTLELRRAGALC